MIVNNETEIMWPLLTYVLSKHLPAVTEENWEKCQ